MSKIGRYIFKIQEKENSTHVHNEQHISEQEQYQIDQYEQRSHDNREFINDTAIRKAGQGAK